MKLTTLGASRSVFGAFKSLVINALTVAKSVILEQAFSWLLLLRFSAASTTFQRLEISVNFNSIASLNGLKFSAHSHRSDFCQHFRSEPAHSKECLLTHLGTISAPL